MYNIGVDGSHIIVAGTVDPNVTQFMGVEFHAKYQFSEET